tara:strand:+ start:422 stop:667 length:246 start_codon:yes stop_codon:yes gene_type:complete
MVVAVEAVLVQMEELHMVHLMELVDLVVIMIHIPMELLVWRTVEAAVVVVLLGVLMLNLTLLDQEEKVVQVSLSSHIPCNK